MHTIPANRPAALGIVGLGSWGEQMAMAAETIPDVHIAACYSRTPQTREDFARRFGCEASHSYENMLESRELDGILVMTPNLAHQDQVLAAAACGKHVLVDKPISVSLEAGLDMVQACEQAGVVLAVGHQTRREAPLRQLKSLLLSGALGAPVLVEGNYSHDGGLHLDENQWRWSRQECPGGPLIQIGIHLVDTLQYLFGQITRVTSWQRRLAVAADIDDVTCTLLEFGSGLIGYLGSTYASRFSHWLTVYATHQNAHYDQFTGLILTHDTWSTGPARDQVSGPAKVTPPVPTLQEQLAEFVHCMRTGERPEVDGTQALRATAVVLAAVESAKTGGPVVVEEMLARAQQRASSHRPTVA